MFHSIDVPYCKFVMCVRIGYVDDDIMGLTFIYENATC